MKNKKLNLSPKMMEQLKKDDAIQIKGGNNSKNFDTNYVACGASYNPGCSINNCASKKTKIG